MRSEQREELMRALTHYMDCPDELVLEMEEIALADVKMLEPALDAMLAQARADGKFEGLLEQAAAAQRNELCRNCRVRSIAVPF